MHASEVWQSPTLKARMFRAALMPLSCFYAAGWQAYLACYRFGFKRASRPHPRVIVVGNLAVGGSGKSPTTLALVRILRSMGKDVVIGCSGYGAPHAEAATIAPDSELSAAEWGDEPAMMRWLEPKVPIVVGRRRVLAAELVSQVYPNAVLVMDDGFQHLPLEATVSLVLEDPAPANVNCLPAGPYREPRRNLKRADAVVWTSMHSGFTLARSTPRFVDSQGVDVVVERATALCALGRPERFLGELAAVVDLVSPVALADHDPMTSGTLFDRLPVDLPIVVTAKDWVKLRVRSDLAGRSIVIALQDVSIEPAEEFRAWLASKFP